MRHRRHRNRGGGEAPPFVDPAFVRSLGGSRREPRTENRKHEHKARQLCRQVQRALNLSLGDCGDDVLRDLYVADVTPTLGSSHLVVHVNVPSGVDVPDVLARLDRVSGLLRAEVARAITRKRAPELTFVPAYAGPASFDEEGELHHD